MKRFMAVMMAVMMVGGLFACTGKKGSKGIPGGSGSSIDRSGSAFVSAQDGGTVVYNDEVALTVPENSIQQDATITVEKTSEIPAGQSDSLVHAGTAYKFGPEGTSFDPSKPAVLEISYNEQALVAKGLSPQTLQIYYFNTELQQYVAVPSYVDDAAKKVVAIVEHFTVYLPFAKSLVPGNNAPHAAIMDPVPNPIRANSPIYIRAQAYDWDGGGSIAGVKLSYRKLRPNGSAIPGPWQTVFMNKEVRPNELSIYGFLIPASFLTSADLAAGNDIEFRVEAIDNLGAVTTASRSIDVTRRYQAGTLSFNPASQTIAAGFERNFVLRGRDTNGTMYNLIPEIFALANNYGTIKQQFAAGVLFHAKNTGIETLSAGFGAESASSAISVRNGSLERISILNESGLLLDGDVVLSEGVPCNFDVLGYDEYGNRILVVPAWTADAAIGTINQDGVLNTNGARGTGTVSATLGAKSASHSVTVYSRAKDITAFSVLGIDGSIDGTNISVTVPAGTLRHSIVSTFTTTGVSVYCGATQLQSGVTQLDMTNPVIFKVFAEDGSWKEYTVTLVNNPADPIYWSRCESIGNLTNAEIGVFGPYVTGSFMGASGVKFGNGVYNFGPGGYGFSTMSGSIYPKGNDIAGFDAGTLSFWGMVSSDATAGYFTVSAYQSYLNGNISLTMETVSGGSWYDRMVLYVNGSAVVTYGISRGVVYHVYMIWDRSRGLQDGKSIRVFVNGVEAMSSSVVFNSTVGQKPYVTLYGSQANWDDWGGASAHLDNLVIWDHVVSENPSWLYNGGAGVEDAMHP